MYSLALVILLEHESAGGEYGITAKKPKIGIKPKSGTGEEFDKIEKQDQTW
jgi:hypothetical protein